MQQLVGPAHQRSQPCLVMSSTHMFDHLAFAVATFFHDLHLSGVLRTGHITNKLGNIPIQTTQYVRHTQTYNPENMQKA